jgi:hypothetical protein
MSNVSLLIYGVAALWGLRGVITLMAAHRRDRLRQLQSEELARREAESQAAAEQAQRLPGKTAVPAGSVSPSPVTGGKPTTGKAAA